MVNGGEQEKHTRRGEQQPLDHAERAGLETDDKLQVIAEGEHSRAGEKPGKVTYTPGKEEPDHGDGA